MYLHTQRDTVTWDNQLHLVTHGLVVNNIVSSSGVRQYGPYVNCTKRVLGLGLNPIHKNSILNFQI
jgi:hypothetical protein